MSEITLTLAQIKELSTLDHSLFNDHLGQCIWNCQHPFKNPFRETDIVEFVNEVTTHIEKEAALKFLSLNWQLPFKKTEA